MNFTLLSIIILLITHLSGCFRNDLSSELNKREREIKDLEQKNSNLQNDLANTSFSYSRESEENKRLRQNLAGNNNAQELTNKQQEINDLNNQINTLKNQLQQAQNKSAGNNNAQELTNKQQEISILNNQISNLKNQLQTAQNKSAGNNNAQELTNKQQEINDLNNQINTLKNQLQQAQNKSAGNNNAQELENKEQKITNLENKLELKKNKLNTLKNSISEKDNKINNLSAELEKYQNLLNLSTGIAASTPDLSKIITDVKDDKLIKSTADALKSKKIPDIIDALKTIKNENIKSALKRQLPNYANDVLSSDVSMNDDITTLDYNKTQNLKEQTKHASSKENTKFLDKILDNIISNKLAADDKALDLITSVISASKKPTQTYNDEKVQRVLKPIIEKQNDLQQQKFVQNRIKDNQVLDILENATKLGIKPEVIKKNNYKYTNLNNQFSLLEAAENKNEVLAKYRKFFNDEEWVEQILQQYYDQRLNEPDYVTKDLTSHEFNAREIKKLKEDFKIPTLAFAQKHKDLLNNSHKKIENILKKLALVFSEEDNKNLANYIADNLHVIVNSNAENITIQNANDIITKSVVNNLSKAKPFLDKYLNNNDKLLLASQKLDPNSSIYCLDKNVFKDGVSDEQQASLMNQLKNATDREKGILFKYLIDKNINNNSLNILEYILDNNNNNQGFNKIAQNKLDRLLYHKNSLEDDKKLLASMLIKKGINIDNFDDALKITDILNKDTTKEPEKTILQNIAKNTVSKFNNKLTELITKIINSQDITKDNLINSYNLNKNESYRYAFIDYLFSKKDENATYITALKEIITKDAKAVKSIIIDNRKHIIDIFDSNEWKNILLSNANLDIINNNADKEYLYIKDDMLTDFTDDYKQKLLSLTKKEKEFINNLKVINLFLSEKGQQELAEYLVSDEFNNNIINEFDLVTNATLLQYIKNIKNKTKLDNLVDKLSKFKTNDAYKEVVGLYKTFDVLTEEQKDKLSE